MKFKRILCGVDFLPASIKAFKIASELAQMFQASLHVMHVVEVYPGVPVWPSSNSEEPSISIEEKAEAALEALIGRQAGTLEKVTLTTEITMGRTYVELVNRAREFKSDLIVLGAKGLTLPEEAIGVGTAEHVIRIASCSVLIVRDNSNLERP